jgi:glycosyltransferase involved in cell wall biosynthesis
VLLITEFFPDSPRAVYGAFQRLGNHILALRALGTVDVVFLWQGGELGEAAAIEKTERARAALGFDGTASFIPVRYRQRFREWPLDLVWAWRGAITFFHKRPSMHSTGRAQALDLRRIVDRIAPDLIFAHRIGAGALVLRAQIDNCPMVLDMDDIEHISLARRARSTRDWFRKYALYVFSLAARFTERRVVAISASALVCSEHDREQLIKIAPHAHVEIAQNTASVFGELGVSGSPTAIFVGVAHYPPNREAILWLANDVWPRVVSALPAARLLIVGEGSGDLPIPSDSRQIEVLGFVPELEGVYRSARLVTCPVRRGSGTRIKIIEAALNGRAVVSTTIGAEGLLFEDGSEILLADSAPAFAQRCVEILADPLRAAALGRAAQRRAQEMYSQERVKSELVALCRKLIAGAGDAGLASVRLDPQPNTSSAGGPGPRDQLRL